MTDDRAPAFSLPAELAADRPPEERGVPRDRVRLLVSDEHDDRDHRFDDLPHLLEPGDLIVVNESATLAASLPARTARGEFRIHLSNRYGDDLWLVEPRWSSSRPGPVPIDPDEPLEVGDASARVAGGFPGIPRLTFLRSSTDLEATARRVGAPIRYGYLHADYPLERYQTVFARVPGSAEMPSAGRPFTRRLVDQLRDRGIEFAPILLHTGVSSLEDGDGPGGGPPIYPEAFQVPARTVDSIHLARRRGGRVIAVGTTVVRALESALGCGGIRPVSGFTRVYLRAERPVTTVDALLTGFHAARTTHLALLSAVAGEARVVRAYCAALSRRYLWHEFGDSHLLWRAGARSATLRPRGRPSSGARSRTHQSWSPWAS